MGTSSKIGDYFVGDSIKILTTVSVSPTTIKIDVWDSGGTQRVDDVSMTEVTSTTFSHIIQTTSSWANGKAIVQTTTTYDGNTNVQEDFFMLSDLSY